MTMLERLAASLADSYRVRRELGSGGMATVYLADDLKHEREVAIKILRPELHESFGASRFLQEIRVTANLQHPNILPLFDSGMADDLLFYVMPYVPGESLRVLLRRERELAVDVALPMLREIADALAYAHARGIVHRDIKPENILLAGRHVVVADFGIAKAIHAAAGGATVTALPIAIGTPGYMAPEQVAGLEVDHRADIYAFGLVAYEILAGGHPFSGTGSRVALTPPGAIAPLSRVRPSVGAAVDHIVMRCLEQRPADRWRSCEDVLYRLNALTGGVPTPAAETTSTAPVDRSFLLDERVCRRLNRSTLDARVIGGAMHYLDNDRASDVLVCYLHGLGGDQRHFESTLRTSPYRAVAPTAFGFENVSRLRIPLSLEDHAVITREFLTDLVERVRPETVLLVGASSGADFGFRLLASNPDLGFVDGFLALGCNVGLDTCFASRAFADIPSSDEQAILRHLNAIGAEAGTLEAWVTAQEYLVMFVRKFYRDLSVLQRYAADVVQPFKAAGEHVFVDWYRTVSARVRRLRVVFEDAEPYRATVSSLRLRQLDEAVLGSSYRHDSLVVDPDTNHFDLMQSDRIARHVEALLSALRAEAD